MSKKNRNRAPLPFIATFALIGLRWELDVNINTAVLVYMLHAKEVMGPLCPFGWEWWYVAITLYLWYSYAVSLRGYLRSKHQRVEPREQPYAASRVWPHWAPLPFIATVALIGLLRELDEMNINAAVMVYILHNKNVEAPPIISFCYK